MARQDVVLHLRQNTKRLAVGVELCQVGLQL